MSGIFVFGEAQFAALKALRAYAETHERTPEDGLGPAGDDPNHVVEIPVGYRVVFTIEQALVRGEDDRAWVRRLSVSSATPGKVPGKEVLLAVMGPLGFRGEVEDCRVHLELIGPGQRAVNVAELIEVPAARLKGEGADGG